MADTDRRALEGLQKVPLLPAVIKKFHEAGIDRWMYCWNMGMNVRCGPKQYGSVYAILRECCQILDMPEPELYMSNNPFPNAFAGGVERPYIVLRSSIIDTLDDQGLYHLIGHELGHIKAGHILYLSVARNLIALLNMMNILVVGLGNAASMALAAAFYEWLRQAEITCDRAGLLCSQNFDVSATANMHLAGGPHRLSHEANLEAFMDQARSYNDMDLMDGIGKVLIWLMYGMYATHPMPIHRVQHLDHWVQEGSFDKILKGTYLRKEDLVN